MRTSRETPRKTFQLILETSNTMEAWDLALIRWFSLVRFENVIEVEYRQPRFETRVKMTAVKKCVSHAHLC